ncbi:microtubule-associated protein, RP/EB family [Enteropsectra breve]|nr:microtubule-associated protein, RP/EB family [Enteropsectra breve]
MNNPGRSFILSWLSSIDLHIDRIEDVGKGAVLCKILKRIDPAFPRFKESPTTEQEFIHNLAVVKKYLGSKQIKLYFPVERMCKLRMQDNLEAIQWFYKYYIKETEKQGLHKAIPRTAAPEANENVQYSFISDSDTLCTEESFTQSSININQYNNHNDIKYVNSSENAAGNNTGCQTHTNDITNNITNDITNRLEQNKCFSSSSLVEIGFVSSEKTSSTAEIKKLKQDLKIRNNKIEVLREFSRVFENERDFYFEKLVKIEKIVCADREMDDGIRNEILAILYEDTEN